MMGYDQKNEFHAHLRSILQRAFYADAILMSLDSNFELFLC